MVNYKFIMKNILLILFLLLFSRNIFAINDIDQWKDTKKTYKDLIEEGFEVKAYDTNTINIEGRLIIILFVTVIKKEKKVYECQEYQTLDSAMQTLDMSIVCRELSKPYQRGVGT